MIATLSGFGDEIHPVLAEQLKVMSREHISFLEIRSVGNINILDLTDGEIDQVKHDLQDAHMKISAIGSPIGKSPILEDDAPFQKRFLRAIEVAKRLDSHHIRIFSFYMPEPHPELFREKILDRFRWMVNTAEQADIMLLHENEKDIYGDSPQRCLDLLESVNSPHLRAIFDPANFIQVGFSPYPYAYELLADYVSYIHVKDARNEDGSVCVVGEGDGRWPEFVSTLNQRGFSGFFSLEPHLGGSSCPGGGADGFIQAATALKRILKSQDADIR